MSEENNVKAGEPVITAQVVVKDKDGNIKYQGPLVMKLKEQKDVGNA